MRILFASSEVHPYSKTGGLGDVVGALPAELARLGHEVLVLSPWYRDLRKGRPLWIGDIEVPFAGGTDAVGVGTLEHDGVRFGFVGHEDFRRESIYGYPDDVRRFCRFTMALPGVAERLEFVPDLLHVHDWHSAYLPMVLKERVRDESLLSEKLVSEGGPARLGSVPPAVLTVHNAQYQGVSGAAETLHWLNLSASLATEAVFSGGSANALRAGCSYADQISTVSPNYAEELTEPEFGYGLENDFQRFRHKLVGILNGIDTEEWNPANDPHLPEPYSLDRMNGKGAAKRKLCEVAGLDEDKPLLAVVSRLAEQKGIDVFLDAAAGLVEQGWSLFLLGTGDASLERRIRELSEADAAISSQLSYDEGHAHLVYAGADALAIPSRFEPCGLSQLIAMRYGTIPIARATGGLRDTIEDGRTGFLFDILQPERLTACAARAMSSYGTSDWKKMMSTAMDQDFSWKRSALQYEEMYRSLTSTSG